MATLDVSKEEFEKFEKVKKSSSTNMLDLKRVQANGGPDPDITKLIVMNYKKLKEKYQV